MINETDVYVSTLKIAENLGIGFVILAFILLLAAIIGVISGTNSEGKK